MATCNDRQLSEAYRGFLMGSSVTVKLVDGTTREIEYFVSDDYLSGRLATDDPMYPLCVELKARFEEHQLNCEACRIRS